MRLATVIFLWLMVLMSLGFGALYLFAPTMMTDAMEYGALAAPAVTDIRAAFGGFQLGAGVFVAWCLRQQRIRLALAFMFLQAFAFALCRGYGLLVDGALTSNLLSALALESVLSAATLALYLLNAPDAAAAATEGPSSAARWFALVVGLVLLVSGVLSALMPVEALGPMGFGPMAPAALTDMRASYGGFQIGLAVFVLWCARPQRLHAGVVCIAIMIGAVLACRLLGLVLDAAMTPALIGAVVFETALTVAAVFLGMRMARAPHVA